MQQRNSKVISELDTEACIKLAAAVLGLEKRDRNHRMKGVFPKVDGIWFRIVSTITGYDAERIRDAYLAKGG